jgi:hypothetical protein
MPWEVGIGYRGAVIDSRGFAPFSDRDYFSQMTLEGSRALFGRGRWTLALGAAWDYGGTSTTTRGQGAGLEAHRLTVPITGRYHVARWLNVFARLAPGAAYVRMHIDDASAPGGTLAKDGWVACGELAAGVAWAFASSRIGKHPFVWWLTGEGGYTLTASTQLHMSPRLSSGDTRAVGTTDLGSLVLDGGFGRIVVAVGF